MTYFPYGPAYGDIFWLSSPSGAVTARFNGDPSDPDWTGVLTEASGLDSPDIRESAEDLSEADGGIHGNFWTSRRPIVLTGTSYGHTTLAQRAARLDKISRASQALRGDSELHWLPNGTVGNEIANPVFNTGTGNTGGWDTGASYWLAAGAALTSVADAPAGLPTTYGTAVTTAGNVVTGGGSNQGAEYALSPARFSVGVPYTFSIYLKTVAGATNPTIFFGESASNGVSATPTITGAWTRYSVTWTPTAVPATVFAGAYIGTAATFRMDGAMVNRGSLATFEDGQTPEMMTWVRRQQPIRYSEGWAKNFQIPLVSQYARLYSYILHTSSQAYGSNLTVENRGSYASLPTLRVTGPINAFTLRNTTNAKALAFTTAIAAGRYIDFDMLNHTATEYTSPGGVYVADRTADINFLTSSWPTVDTGNNVFAFDATTGTTGATLLTVLWRDTWL